VNCGNGRRSTTCVAAFSDNGTRNREGMAEHDDLARAGPRTQPQGCLKYHRRGRGDGTADSWARAGCAARRGTDRTRALAVRGGTWTPTPGSDMPPHQAGPGRMPGNDPRAVIELIRPSPVRRPPVANVRGSGPDVNVRSRLQRFPVRGGGFAGEFESSRCIEVVCSRQGLTGTRT
jgi:hypothetical protein